MVGLKQEKHVSVCVLCVRTVDDTRNLVDHSVSLKQEKHVSVCVCMCVLCVLCVNR